MQTSYYILAFTISRNLFFQWIYFIINWLHVTNPLFIQLIEHH